MVRDTAQERRLQASLLRWYDRKARPLPWRATQDPYRIWVSEIMLQQTQVKTVEAYYSRFLARFPTVEALAAAAPDEVLKAWEGLGYYGRARALHRAAREVAERLGSRVPDTLAGLRALPGIGRYTAGAILSIAFGKPAPALDGNVIRVLARVFRITDDVGRSDVRESLWTLAGRLLPPRRVRDYNQALMELGALVCRPRDPLCPECPLAALCEAKRLSLQRELPVKAPRKPVPHHEVTAAVIGRREEILITRRPPHGLLGGLWEFPGGKREPGETLEACLRREIREELGIAITVGERLATVKHAYTHFRITLHAFACRSQGGRIRCLGVDDYCWIRPEELDRFALPAADHKLIALLKPQWSRNACV